MKIHGITLISDDVIVCRFLIIKGKLMSIGIAGATAVRRTFEKYYKKEEVDRLMIYNRHGRKVSLEILEMYEEVYKKEFELIHKVKL